MDSLGLVRNLINPPGGDETLWAALLKEDVTLRVWRWDGSIAARGRQRVVDWLREEWDGWPDATLEVYAPAGQAEASGVQFRIQATEDGRFVEHNRALFVTYMDGLIDGIDLYCGEPIFSAHRQDYIAPASMSDDEVRAFLEEGWHSLDVREWFPQNWWRHASRRVTRSGSGEAHPGSNFVGGSRWTAEEAEARIDEILDEHQRKAAGFVWWVMPFDIPADMGERLERRGLMLAGQNVRMARVGLADLSDIPENEDVVVEQLDGSNDEDLETMLQILATCFHIPAEEIDAMRPGYVERVRNPERRQKQMVFIARVEGLAVGMATLGLRGGCAFLDGAATLPERRGQHVYSTLLKHRLTMARVRGYHLAAIDAGPMSKRVVEKYGFKEYGTINVYGWMPQMDPEVIRSLVPDE